MGTKLGRIAEISVATRRPIFTSLYHLINEDLLKECHRELDGKKAVGIDKVTKEEYGKNLEENLVDLVARMKKRAYKPKPARRVEIPKDNGKTRPLSIYCYEDKLVQEARPVTLKERFEKSLEKCRTPEAIEANLRRARQAKRIAEKINRICKMEVIA